MTDSLTRGFGAQLTTSMDAVLRRAVFEIMNIFENTVYDYRMEIAHKGEEVAQLKIKLQTAELRLKEKLCDNSEEMIQISDQTKTPPEAAPETLKQPNHVSEIDVDVPEDWCAPLGSETVTIQDFGICPNIKLRPLSIPLCHVPIHKTEGGYRDVATRLKATRRSRRFPSSNSQNIIPGEKGPALKNRRLVIKLEKYSCDVTEVKELRRSKRKSSEEANKQGGKMKKKKKDSAVAPRSTSVDTVERKVDNIYTCSEVFDTKSNQSVHERLHRRCSGCKKILPSPKTLVLHRISCTQYKTLMESTAGADTPSSDGKSASKTNVSTKMYSSESEQTSPCPFFLKRHKKSHLRKMFIPCSHCPVLCRSTRGLNIHLTKMHKIKANSDNKVDLTWTEPLEEMDEETRDVISICTKSSQQPNHKVKERQNSDLSVKLQAMSKPKRKCLLCHKLFSKKYDLIQHMILHK